MPKIECSERVPPGLGLDPRVLKRTVQEGVSKFPHRKTEEQNNLPKEFAASILSQLKIFCFPLLFSNGLSSFCLILNEIVVTNILMYEHTLLKVQSQ